MKIDDQTLNYTNCPLCNSSRSKFVFKRINNSSIVRCLDCSLHYMNPMYSEEELNKLYVNSNYFENYGNLDKYFNYNEFAKQNKKSHFFYRLNLLKKYLQEGTMLDIGSGFGDFLDFVSRNSTYRIKGLEINSGARNISKKRFPDILIYNDYVENLKLTEKFNIVSFFAVLEHIRNPHFFIEEIKKILVEKGIIYVSVPNINTYYFLRTKWADYSISLEHLIFYSPKTLTKLMDKHGFELLMMKTKKFDLRNQPIHYRIIHSALPLFNAGKELEAIFRLR